MEEIYMSKSSEGSYSRCPKMYKYSYIDRIRGGNQSTTIGTDVHNFIEEVFKVVKPNIETGKLDNISKLKLFPNLNYKKNVLLLESNRWKNICNLPIGRNKKYELFRPVMEEEKMRDEENQLVGIVDRVHKCHLGDAFAPEFKDFKDGDLVIVENKTGLYDKRKAQSYEEELLWYRMLIKASKGIDIRWGAIYFPIGNNIHYVDLDNEKFDEEVLLFKINKTREYIQDGLFIATPSTYVCNGCFYKDICEDKKSG